MNEFSQATFLYHVFQKRDSYVHLCKFAQSSVTLSFVLFEDFFNLHLLTLLLSFLSDYLGDTKTIRPFALKGHDANLLLFAKCARAYET